MIQTSSCFSAAATAQVRFPYARVEVTWTDSSIDPSLVVSTNSDNAVSYKDQVYDGIESAPYKWAHFCNLALDGTRCLMPSEESVEYQVGWRSAAISGVNSVFSTPYPSLTIEFATRGIESILVVGDDKYGEYPVEFTVKIYNGATLLYTHSVGSNNAVRYSADISSEGILEATKSVLTISKWSAPSSIAKISEFYTSVSRLYYGDDIVSLNFIEEMEVSEGTLPVGNIAASEVDVELQNLDNMLSPSNPDSPLHTFIRHNRRVRVWLGYLLQWDTLDVSSGDYIVEGVGPFSRPVGFVPLGVFWSGDWEVSDTGATARTTCRDMLDRLSKTSYSSSVVRVDATLYDMAVDVLDSAKAIIPEIRYEIDSELMNTVIPYAYLEKKTHREALRIIAEAALGVVWCSRTGVIRVGGKGRFTV